MSGKSGKELRYALEKAQAHLFFDGEPYFSWAHLMAAAKLTGIQVAWRRLEIDLSACPQ